MIIVPGADGPLVEIVGRSARVSLSATAIAVIIGIPAGTGLALTRFRGRQLLATFVYTGMALPTTVVGLVVALVLFRSGPLGSLNLIYTTEGMVIAQAVIAAPLICGITLAAIRALPAELPDQLLALGANRRQMVVRLWLEARVPLLAAVMAGFGHAISEVGAATMVGGNIHGQTQVLTTATVEDVSRGNFGSALGYGAVLLALAFVVNALLTTVQQRGAGWSQS
jgi:tungstate transport system permease protein